jgi:hypothetical protein
MNQRGGYFAGEEPGLPGPARVVPIRRKCFVINNKRPPVPWLFESVTPQLRETAVLVRSRYERCPHDNVVGHLAPTDDRHVVSLSTPESSAAGGLKVAPQLANLGLRLSKPKRLEYCFRLGERLSKARGVLSA